VIIVPPDTSLDYWDPFFSISLDDRFYQHHERFKTKPQVIAFLKGLFAMAALKEIHLEIFLPEDFDKEDNCYDKPLRKSRSPSEVMRLIIETRIPK